MAWVFSVERTSEPVGDIVVVPMDGSGRPGTLNKAIATKLGVDHRNGFPFDESHEGFRVIWDTPTGPTLLFIHTTTSAKSDLPAAQRIETNLAAAQRIERNLASGLVYALKRRDKFQTEIWCPLLGTGDVGLPFDLSARSVLLGTERSLAQMPPLDVKLVIAAPPDMSDDDFKAFRASHVAWPSRVLQNFKGDYSLGAATADEEDDPAPKRDRPVARVVRMARGMLPTLGDDPITTDGQDTLDYGAYADAIATVIRNPKLEEPLVIAIDAPWGTGKSSLGRLIQGRLENEPDHDVSPQRVFWFNAWLHDDAERLPGAFISALARAADSWREDHSPFTRLGRWFRPLSAAFLTPGEATRRRWWRLFWAVVLIAIATALLWSPINDLLDGDASGNGFLDWLMADSLPKNSVIALILGTILVTVSRMALSGLVALTSKAFSSNTNVSAFVADASIGARHGSLDRAREELRSLLTGVVRPNKRIVIFIDDLERCRPPIAVDLLETVTQLLNFPPVVVVIMTDLEVLAHCIDIKYEKLADRQQTKRTMSFGGHFMKKLVQLEFILPPVPRKIARRVAERTVPESESAIDRDEGSFLRPKKQNPIMKKHNARIFSIITDNSYNILSLYCIFVLLMVIFTIIGVISHGVFPIIAISSSFIIPFFLYLAFKITSKRRRSFQQFSEEFGVSSDEPIDTSGTLTPEEKEAAAKSARDVRRATGSGVYAAASDRVLELVETRPRTVKRILNRIQMLIIVLHRRAMLEGEDAPSDKAIGAWAAFEEMWPTVYRRCLEEPDLASKLATPRDSEAFSFLSETEREGFEAFLGKAPEVADVARRMIYLRPIADLD